MIQALGLPRVPAYGYWADPAETVSGVDQHVWFTTFVFEAAGPEPLAAIEVALEAPLSWPAAWSSAVVRLPSG